MISRASFSLVLHFGEANGLAANNICSMLLNVEYLANHYSFHQQIWQDTGQGVLQSSPFIYNGASMSLNSFVTHAFEAREMPGKNGNCLGNDQTCRVGYFAVNKNDDQREYSTTQSFYALLGPLAYRKTYVWFLFVLNRVFCLLNVPTEIFVDDSFVIKHSDNKSVARESADELLSECEQQVYDELEEEGYSTLEAIATLKHCVSSGIAVEVERANEEIQFQSQIRKKMAESFENYTCADHDLATSEPEDKTTWKHDGITRDVHILLDRPASKVHVVKNFIAVEECAAMEDQARPKLHKATVADGKGGSELSPNRKALQAGIKIPWHLEEEGNRLTTLSRRVYDYVNNVLDMDIDEHGQEDLMSIQYEGRGDNDETPDRYMPHCDGDCNGMQHKAGQRMATMVIYCSIPEKGGATNFRNSGLHIVPEVGSATFFSYINPEAMKMDNGFTEHSGCPVITGEKKIVTQWVRYGVDKENPWDSFNTLGIKIGQED